MIDKYLDDLEQRIDPNAEDTLYAEWQTFTDGDFTGDIFSPRRMEKIPSSIEWPAVSVNKALEDMDLMALQQLSSCSANIAEGNGLFLAVRANYGTGILSSVFGAELFVMDENMNTLPTTRPLTNPKDTARRLLDEGVPDFSRAYGARTLEMAQYLIDIFKNYPKVSRYVHFYHPDLQSPMDLCELLWGSELFLDIVDEPDLVGSFIDLITETYKQFLRQWNTTAPPEPDYAIHWAIMHKGCIMLRSDSAMNFSPEMHNDFIRPYDQKLFDEFGGGAIHFCGRGDHYIEGLSKMDGIHAVNMSQPEYNDMEMIYQNTIDKDIKLIGFQRAAAESALKDGRNLHGNVHCTG